MYAAFYTHYLHYLFQTRAQGVQCSRVTAQEAATDGSFLVTQKKKIPLCCIPVDNIYTLTSEVFLTATEAYRNSFLCERDFSFTFLSLQLC